MRGDGVAGEFGDRCSAGWVRVYQAVERLVARLGLFVVEAAFLDVLYELRNGGAEVDEQVRRGDELVHQLEQGLVVLEIAGGHQAHRVEVGRENVCVFVDGPVLNDGLALFLHLDQLRETRLQEVDLQVEGPPRHVLVEIVQVRVVVHLFEVGGVAVVFGQQRGQGGFPRADVSCDGEMHEVFVVYVGVKNGRPK